MSDTIVHETGRNPPWNGSFQPSPYRAQQKSNRALNQALSKAPESSFILRFCPPLRANGNGAGSEPSPLLIPASEYKWHPYLPLSSKNHRNPLTFSKRYRDLYCPRHRDPHTGRTWRLRGGFFSRAGVGSASVNFATRRLFVRHGRSLRFGYNFHTVQSLKTAFRIG